MKKLFDKKYLVDELDLPWTAIYDEITDNSRWSIYHKIVFEDDGKFWSTSYSVGATECQDERPWDYEDKIECYEVELKEVMKTEWVVKE